MVDAVNTTNDMPLASPSTSNKRCYLLELAAELRNRIYGNALIKDDVVIISRHGIAQPGLLRTCRQIREEARAIYYCRNDFDILHGLYDVSVARLFFKQAEGFWDNYKKTEYHLGDISYQTSYTRPKWDKALLWLQAYHSDEVTRYVCSCDGTDGQRGCCRFEKAFEIINCVNHLAWESVKLMLNAYRKAVQNETDTTWY